MGRAPHRSFTVGPAQQGDDLRIELANAAQQGEGGGVLLKSGGAADEAGSGLQDSRGRALDENGRRTAQGPQVAHQELGLVGSTMVAGDPAVAQGGPAEVLLEKGARP